MNAGATAHELEHCCTAALTADSVESGLHCTGPLRRKQPRNNSVRVTSAGT